MTPEQIKKNRKKAKLSQLAVCRDFGVCERFYRDRETGVVDADGMFSRAMRDLSKHPKDRP